MRVRGGLAGVWCVLGLFGIALLLSGAPGAAAASGPEAPSTAPTPAPGAGGGVSDTIVYGSHTLTYTVTGVTTGPDDTPAHRSGTVTGATVTVSGSVLYAGGVTNLSMSAGLSVTGGEPKSASWPPQGVSGRLSGQAVNFPFSLQVTIPPAPGPDAMVEFSISSQNCGDSGVCGGPSVDGSFPIVPTTPEETPTPTPTETPTAEPCVDSGARFTSISREVEFQHEGDKDRWGPAKMDTQLCVDDHVRTSEDSSAIIGFSDLSTFVLKPESEIVVTLPPARDSKLKLLFGNIWVNVKKMATNGTLEVDMSQGVAGIKGTTFVLSETGTTSTLKVIEGTVSFTAKATGQTVEVSTGQTVQADATGLSPVTSFDVNAESADWAKLGAGTATGADSGLPVALLAGLAGLVVLLLAGIFVVARQRGRRPLLAPSGLPPVMPPAPPAAPGFVPTHAIPPEGLTAWAVPDPQTPGIMLPGRLPIVIVERVGDWAHVVAENGWSGWVDGRRFG